MQVERSAIWNGSGSGKNASISTPIFGIGMSNANRSPAPHTKLLHLIDLAGTLVLAVQGASIGAVKGLDALGVVSISLATALGGGIMRDILLGQAPPEALRGPSLITVALCGGVLTFFAYHSVEQLPEAVLTVIDALGLALLAVSGTEKALEKGLTPVAVVMIGAISGAGGYTLRDILLAEIPAVLRVDFLASAAILGAVVLILSRKLGAPANVAAVLGGLACFVSRLAGVYAHWHLPIANLQ